MNKNKGKTIGELTRSRRVWQLKPVVRVIQSGKVYDRKKKIEESEYKEQKIQISSCI